MKKHHEKILSRRKFVISGLYVGGGIALCGRLYSLQITNNEKYNTLSDKNRIRYFMTEAKRGKLLDVNEIILADNYLAYHIFYDIYTKDSKINVILDKLREFIELTELNIKEIHKQLKVRTSNIIIKKNIKWDEIVAVESNIFSLPGIYISHTYKRVYSYSFTCAHIIGYIASDNRGGISGLEHTYDKELTGKPGIILREVNSRGITVSKTTKAEAVTGQDIKISINSSIQSFAYNALLAKTQNMKSGAAIVMDINSGKIIALVNLPSYDNNIFVNPISHEDWQSLTDSTSYPLINRCINFKLNPGSTFKMIAAISALETGLITPDTEFECTGHIDVGGSRFHCWKKEGHGKISVQEAISRSCNVYFYKLALKISLDELMRYAKIFSLGEYFNLGLKDEGKTFVPDKKWRTQNIKRWYLGDTINTIIGHGYLIATPLQLAVMSARIASGRNIVPTLQGEDISTNFEPLKISKDSLLLVQRGMFDVINSLHGTARSIASRLHHIAGKTGTTQILSNTSKNNESSLIVKHTSFFSGYAPYQNPKYAIVVMMEQGGGGKNSARIAKNILDFSLK